MCVNENRVGLSVFHSSGIKVRSMSRTGLVVIIPLISVMLKGIALLFAIATVLSPVLCCDWLAHFGHLSHQSLSLIRIMVSPLWNSYQELLHQVAELFADDFIEAPLEKRRSR